MRNALRGDTEGRVCKGCAKRPDTQQDAAIVVFDGGRGVDVATAQSALGGHPGVGSQSGG